MRTTLSKLRLTMSASVLAVGIAALPGTANAATCNWLTAAGNWATNGNWSCGAAPGQADDAVITSSGAIVSFSGLSGGAATVNLGTGNALNITDGSTFRIYNGAITNNGTLTVASNSDLVNSGGPITVSGNGALVFDNSAANVRLYGGSWIFGSGQTVRGAGQIGIGQTIITNNGLFSANVNGATLAINVTGGSGGVGPGNGVGTGANAGFLNSGTLQASGGGILSIDDGLYENTASGVIQALNGSTVNLTNDARILNGTLTSVGTGAINATGGTEYLTNVTLSAGSKLNVASGNTLVLDTLFTNNGTLTIDNASDLRNQGGTTLTINGSGSIVLGGTGNNRIYGGNIVFGSNQNVSGTGQLGIGQTTITNNSLFSVGNGGSLSIDALGGNGGVGSGNGVGTGANAGLFNNGIIEATGGATVSLENGLYENAAGGIIRAGTGSAVNLNNDARILNGTLTSTGSGAINATSGTEYLTGVTLSSGSNLNVASGNVLYLDTHFTNNGTLTINNASDLRNQNSGTLLIDGSGAIVLGTSGNNRIYGGNITFGAGQTVQGAGQLGVGQTTFTINNVFSANAGSVLSIDVTGGNGGVGAGNGVGTNGNAGLFNTSTMQATGGSSLNFEGGLYENDANGVLQALAGSSVNLDNDARILNGTLTSVGTGAINATSGTEYLSNVTLSAGSKLNVASGNTLYLDTVFTNNGTLTIDNASDLRNQNSGTLTINGTGAIVLGTNGSNRIFGGNIVFGSNQNVSGTGQLGLGQTTIVNNNVFSVGSGGNLLIDVSAGNGGLGVGNGLGTNTNSGLLNNGVIEATGGGTVSFNGGLYENAANGIIRAGTGSIVNLNNDARILNGTLTSIGTGAINTAGGTEYLTNVTLSSGSQLNVTAGNTLNLNTGFTNNGTTTVDNASDVHNETGTLTIDGTGTLTLGVNGNNRIFGGFINFGPDLTVQGVGQIGLSQTIITNDGTITANVSGRTLSIDASAGNGGVGAGNGIGTNGNSALLNNGVLAAENGGLLSIEGGLYENGRNGLGGELFAAGGGVITFNNDASFQNLLTGGVFDGGRLYANDGTINLRSNAADSIVTIGGASDATTEVILEGAGSVIEVTPFGGGSPVTIDQTLQSVSSFGVFALHNRDFTVAANGGNFSNAGLTFVNNTVFTASSFANSGTLNSDGVSSVVAPIANSGTVHVGSGVLTTQAITGFDGTIAIDGATTPNLPSATLNLGGASTVGTLINNGTLGLNGNNITVSNDYTNASFGSGNAFSGHNGVTGSGLILATSATMDVTGTALSGNTLNVGNVRTGGSSSTAITITNNGVDTILRGAVQNTNAPSIALSAQDFVLNPNGGNTTINISYTGLTAGSLAGQTINLVNNFDNVATQAIGLIGNIYQAAQAGAQPATVTLGARRVGDAAATTSLTIANVAPVTPGFNDTLTTNASTGSGFLLNGGGSASITNLAAGSSTSIALSHGTGTSGAFSSTVALNNTSVGVAGSGLSDLTLASQSIQVNGNVYAAAAAGLSSNVVNFGTVRKGATAPTGGVTITNTGSGALTDSLVTSVNGLPGNVTGSGPASLAAGQSGAANFALNTSTAGIVSGSATLGFVSHDSELADLSLGSQAVTFSGTVTDLAAAAFFKNAGLGTFTGSGTSYSLDLGTLTANSGTFSFDLGVLNAVTNSAFSESLGGSFTSVGGTGYSFVGNSFSGLAGGAANTGNLLTFDTTGLTSGGYTSSLTFNGYSAYPQLSNLNLAGISLNIVANVTGGATGAVPEPTTWAMMMMGFGLVGGAMRRRKAAPRVAYAA